MSIYRVNGRNYDLSPNPTRTLADTLRNDLGFIGVRVSCAEGECGACTILVDGEPSCSCMMLAPQGEDREIVTIEGIGTPDSLHPIQQAFIEEQGFQCAFCTPGFIMAAKAFLAENPNPTPEEVQTAMSGNICRCGAYPYIVKAVLKAAADLRAKGGRTIAAE